MNPNEVFLHALVEKAPSLNINTDGLHRAFEALHVRQWGLPTGVTPGRMWRTETASGVWWLHGFVPHRPDHCRVAGLPVFLLPVGATVVREGEYVVLRCAERVVYYGPGRVRIGLLQWDAQALAGGAL